MVGIVGPTNPTASPKRASWVNPSSAPLSRTLSPFSGRTSPSDHHSLSSVTSVSSNSTDDSQRLCRQREAESAKINASIIADRDRFGHNAWSRKMLLNFGKHIHTGISFVGRRLILLYRWWRCPMLILPFHFEGPYGENRRIRAREGFEIGVKRRLASNRPRLGGGK